MIWSYELCGNWLDGLCSREEKENHPDQDPESWKPLACSEVQLKGIKSMINYRRQRMDKLEQLVDKALEFYYGPRVVVGYMPRAEIDLTQEELNECETSCRGRLCPYRGIRCWEVQASPQCISTEQGEEGGK